MIELALSHEQIFFKWFIVALSLSDCTPFSQVNALSPEPYETYLGYSVYGVYSLVPVHPVRGGSVEF